MARDVSLEGAHDDGFAPVDRIAAPAPSPEETAAERDEHALLSKALHQVVQELSPRERRIVNERWLRDDVHQ